MVDIIDYISGDNKYYIYGTTSLGIYIYEKIVALHGEDNVLGFIETKPMVRRYLKKIVFSPYEIVPLGKDVRIIIASATHFEEMQKTLIYCGYPSGQIIIPYRTYENFKTLYGIERHSIKTVCFWPPISEENQNLIKKIEWFIPDRIKVSIWSKEENLRRKFNDNVYIEKKSEKDNIFEKTELIFLWDIESDEIEYTKYSSKVFIIDPNFYLSVETLNYCKIYYYSFSDIEKKAFEKKSKEILIKLKKKFQGYSKARIFCSGPSIDEIHENTYMDSLNIICNSMVKDKEWLKRIKPDILAFTDPNYYFSPTEYCKKFFEDALEGLRLYDYYIVVYDYEVPLLLFHYPELEDKIIGIANDSPQFTYPSESELRVRGTKNILTETMLPLASALCDEIEIAGCTGRNPDEDFYWKHNGRTQYLDLMHTIFEMYPSVFRDQNYANYYEYHCQCVEELLEYGEERGKRYKNLTTSYIPALKNRTVRD